jgi:hypothetical protein
MTSIKAGTDPIFMKIEAHQTAVRTWLSAGDVSGRMEDNDPAYEAADRTTNKASAHEMKTLRALLRCRPTTLAGVIALLDHLGQPHTLRDADREADSVLSSTHTWWPENKDEVRAFPRELAAALRSLVGSTAGAA